MLLEESSGDTTYTSYIYAFGKTFAKIDGVINTTTIATAEISYFHHDNLGSSRLMTDGEGKVVMDQDYLPFGDDLPRVGQVGVMDEEAGGYKYTGQKEVVSIGLYYYGSRYYDPSIGRFITEDTYPGEMGNSQSQNLYIYTMNNPLRYVDPTGHYTVDGEKVTIEKSDNLEDIALDLYGDKNAAFYLALRNELESINAIIEGQIRWAPEAMLGEDYQYYRLNWKGNVREVPDAFIAFTTLGAGALYYSGAIPVIETAGSSLYAAADKAIEKTYYWMSDKVARGLGYIGNKLSRLFTKSGNKVCYSTNEEVARMVSQKLNGSLIKLKNGYKVEVTNGNRPIIIRIMNSGSGNRLNPYFRVSIPGKGSLTLDGILSSQRAQTHIDMTDEYLQHIINMVQKYQGK